MRDQMLLEKLNQELELELKHIMDWWLTELPDPIFGGFYGRLLQNEIHQHADKGIILHSRLLWSFAAAQPYISCEILDQQLTTLHDFLMHKFWDPENRGFYWMLDYTGEKIISSKKQSYAQAFGIYALSEYYQRKPIQKVLEIAKEIYHCLESFALDQEYGGYIEAFAQDWSYLADQRLSGKDMQAEKTMNTHLHILEAYTNLYRSWKDPQLKNSLKNLLALFIERFIDSNLHLHLFFSRNWQRLSQEISFGHDIEAAWLMLEAAEILGDHNLIEQTRELSIQIADTTLLEGVDQDGGLFNEAKGSQLIDTDKHWWPQAEAMVGFFNAYTLTGDSKYLQATLKTWSFIKTFIKDHTHGEWHWRVNTAGQVISGDDKAGAWKAPYHNGRMCIELIKRINSIKYASQ